jgi:hypothetical protein
LPRKKGFGKFSRIFSLAFQFQFQDFYFVKAGASPCTHNFCHAKKGLEDFPGFFFDFPISIPGFVSSIYRTWFSKINGKCVGGCVVFCRTVYHNFSQCHASQKMLAIPDE